VHYCLYNARCTVHSPLLCTSTTTGSIAVSPIAASAITGFSLTADSTNVFSKSGMVSVQVKAANYAVPTPSDLTTAVSNMEAAYTDAAGRPNNDDDKIDIGLKGEIGGLTLKEAGVYAFGSSVHISDELTFEGKKEDIFIIQMTGDLIQATATNVILSSSTQSEDKPLAKNIFWQVAGHVNIGAKAHMEGVLLVNTHATFNFQSSLNGRILAQTAVTLDDNDITEPA
jgi:hypothetical protein